MTSKKHDTLCWLCEKAGGKCSWSKDFTPVEGWEAKPTKVKADSASQHQYIDSFIVYECPEFELLEAVKEQKVAKDGQTRHIKSESRVENLLRKKYNQAKKERAEK